MKWVLFYLIVTADGVTESQSDFVTWSQCNEAAEELHRNIRPDTVLVQTECKEMPK